MMSTISHPSRSKAFVIFEGGGVKGAALVGALAEAEKHVHICGVGGASAGAIVAALYAAGFSASEIQEAMVELPYKKLARWCIIPRGYALHSSAFLYNWLRDKLSIKLHGSPGQQVTFGELAMPLKIVAADIRNREMIIFSAKDAANTEVAHAVRMSMSIPLFYELIELRSPSGSRRRYCK